MHRSWLSRLLLLFLVVFVTAYLVVGVSADVVPSESTFIISKFSLYSPRISPSALGTTNLGTSSWDNDGLHHSHTEFLDYSNKIEAQTYIIHDIYLFPLDPYTFIASKGDTYTISLGGFSYLLQLGESKYDYNDFEGFIYKAEMVGVSGQTYEFTDDQLSFRVDTNSGIDLYTPFYLEIDEDSGSSESVQQLHLRFYIEIPYQEYVNNIEITFRCESSPFNIVLNSYNSVPGKLSTLINDVKELPTKIGNTLQEVFIPDKATLNVQVDRIKDVFKQENFGAVFEAGSIIQNFFSTLPATVADADTSITFPGVSVDLAGVPFEIEEQEVLVVPRGFEALQIASKLITSIVCSLAAINALENIGRKILRY